MASASPWNSLEVAKLLVDVATPVAVVLLGIWVGRATRRVEASQWVNQKLIEKRISLLDQVLPDLNDMYCYYSWVGNWKELSPAAIIERKRKLDRTFFANQPFFTAGALEAYLGFSQALFKTYSEPGEDARLRTGTESNDGNRKTSYPGTWEPEWTAMFTKPGERVNRKTVASKYRHVLAVLGSEIDITKG
jgi:hypothetical protein